MDHFEKIKLYELAIRVYGEKQLDMLVEECAELIQAIQKRKRGFNNVDNVAEEIADVEIMLEQCKILLGNERLVLSKKQDKLKRLQGLVSYEEDFEKEKE